MTALLIAGASVIGLVAGALLDPLGQQLAARSSRKHRSKHEAPPAQPVEPVAYGPVRESGWPPQLLPVGFSPIRTLGAALITGGLFAGAAHRFGPHPVLVPFCVFFAALVVVSTTDLSYGLIPRLVVYPAMAAVVGLLVAVAGADGQWHRLGSAAIGAAAAFIVLFVIWWLAPRGMGFGDVRLSALIGLATGWIGLLDTYVALLSAFVVGLLFGIATAGLRGIGRKIRVPFAPALALGAIVAVFWGAPIVQAALDRTI
ncbi:MAG: leader peptidase (prepilin peptidase) / N-methyltransferase [Acidimicrobiaceae bacterium]|nr:leader peptidase (prepilin peptidase) / N-methyltransferase [Acidimicrobiaceae bacterium]